MVAIARIPLAILDDYQGVALSLGPWRDLGDAVDVTVFTESLDGDDVLARQLAPFEIIVAMRERTPFPRARLERLQKLRLLVTTGMSNASIDLDAARDLDITVAGTGALMAPTVELTWGLILAVTRNISVEAQAIRDGGWQHTIGPELAGRTLGIVGLGRVGTRVAAIGRAFDMRVIAWSENLRADAALTAGAEAVAKHELLAQSDVVTIHTRLSERTRHLIGAAELDRMKSTAYLVNTSRGEIVDEAALLAALHEGAIAGAALDVFEREPLPSDHPLRTAPRALLTPHLGYVSIGSFETFFRDAADDIATYLRDEPVRVLNG